jgi:hypothetical protein
MRLQDFRIGAEFLARGERWRCTDIGTRVVAAIRVEYVEVGGTEPQTLNHDEATARGWFNGPPYAVAEVLFDEDDQAGCSPIVGAGLTSSAN